MDYGHTVKCTFLVIEKFFNGLRKNKLYDKTAIIIASDHGYKYENRHAMAYSHSEPFAKRVGVASPILMFKNYNSHGDVLTYNDDPVSSIDIGATFCDLAGASCAKDSPAVSLIAEERHAQYKNRKRLYAHHSYAAHTDFKNKGVTLYEVKTPIYDPRSWIELKQLPGSDANSFFDR